MATWEWCADWYDRFWYSNRIETDPLGPSRGDSRVLRGGSFSCTAQRCRSGQRGQDAPNDCSSCIGFRVAISLLPGP
jgi:formylglycine-generating enzyme required for sulfatase activity